MKKKVFLMTIALLCTAVQGIRAEFDVWDGVTKTCPQWQNANSIRIKSAAELAYVREHWTENYPGKNLARFNNLSIFLDADLDMGDTPWVPLGSNSGLTLSIDAFYGRFYGQGHTIRINIPDAGENYQGLFARIGDHSYVNPNSAGLVMDLHVEGKVACETSRLVGGIAGENYGVIEGCWVSADVSSNWQESLSAYTAKVGGITGENHGIIKYCCVTGNVTNNDADVGGLVGYNHDGAVIDNCAFYGTRYSTHAQHNIYIGAATGTLTNEHNGFTDEELDTYLNSFTGYAVYRKALQQTPYTVTINNESNLTATPQQARPGQIITLTAADGNNILHIKANDADGNFVAEWYSPFATTGSTFAMPSSDVTVTTSNSQWAGKGTVDDPYLVSTPGEWEQIHQQMMESTQDNVFSGTYFKQTADINITQGIGVTGQGNSKAFCGIYDGDNHNLNCTLTNPVSGSTEAVAPFHLVNGATIKNLHVTGTISGGIHSAGLVAITSGSNRVSIENCRVSADITCTGNSINNAHGGGIIGHAGESEYVVTSSLFDGKIIALSNGVGAMHIGAIVGLGGGSTRIINTTIEKGSYEGAEKSQIAFCWQNDANCLPSSYAGNYYFSDLGHSDAAEQLLPVESGTEGLLLQFSNDTWEEAYQGALSKSGTHYMIDGTFYTASGSSASFKLSHHTVWNVTKVYANAEEVTSAYGGLYTISNITAPTTITVTYNRILWTDEGRYADAFSTVDETEKTVTINTPEELARLAKLVYDGTDSGNGWTYNLNADLDMSKYDWAPIGNGLTTRFQGTFDGQGHTISGIRLKGTSQYVGLFGVVNGTVKNLKLADSSIEGRRYVGAIAGDSRFDIVNCYVGDDVTVTAVTVEGNSDSGKDCGGIVGNVQNQDSGHGYTATDAYVRGCYSAATVNGVSHVGGIVGNMNSGTVHYNVSQATVTGTDGTVAYVVGNNNGGNMPACNFYISDTESSNSNDVRPYHITLSDDLKKKGFSISHENSENFDVSGLYFSKVQSVQDIATQFLMGGEWYGVDNKNFYFNVNHENGMTTVDDVKVNGTAPTLSDNDEYYFKVTADAAITADPAITLYDDCDIQEIIFSDDQSRNNINIIYYNNGMTANVTLEGRTLYKNNTWNTICLPFDVTISGSVLDGADVRTLESSSFNSTTGTLTLNFSTSSLTKIEAGMPYIIKWSAGDNIVNPKFENVTIKFDPEEGTTIVGTEDVDPAVFYGNYSNSTFPLDNDGYPNYLYMGANNKLYYPYGSNLLFSINSFRAYFRLQNDIEVGNPSQGAKSIVMKFGDDEIVTEVKEVIEVKEVKDNSWYSLDGRKLNGKPTTKGIYIHNGKKIVIK